MKEHIAFKIFKREREEYFPLYQTFLTAQHMSRTVPNGPKFSVYNFGEFCSGTKQVLRSILGVNGVPLSYVIRNIKCRLRNSALSCFTRDKKIYWKAPLNGANFEADNHRVWMYLLQRCRNTPGLIRIQRYKNNGREVWSALCRNHGVVDIEPPDDTTYKDDDYTYIIHHLPIYSDKYN